MYGLLRFGLVSRLKIRYEGANVPRFKGFDKEVEKKLALVKEIGFECRGVFNSLPKGFFFHYWCQGGLDPSFEWFWIQIWKLFSDDERLKVTVLDLGYGLWYGRGCIALLSTI